MTSSNRVDNLAGGTVDRSTRLSTTLDISQQTPHNSLGDRFKNSLNVAAGVIVNTASAAGAVVGAPVVSAAVSQVSQLSGGAQTGGVGLQTNYGGGSVPGLNFAGNGGGGGGGIASSALGTALQFGTPGVVQASSNLTSGIPGLSGAGSNLTSTGAATTSTVATGGVSTDPFSSITGSTTSAGGYQNYFSSMGQQQYQMLNLQIAMQQEYQFFATLSNVLKTRNDTVKNTISNVR
jgi:hypothetical protein